MIPLAQYLDEFDQDPGATGSAGQGAEGASASKPARRGFRRLENHEFLPAFEHLRVIEGAGTQTDDHHAADSPFPDFDELERQVAECFAEPSVTGQASNENDAAESDPEEMARKAESEADFTALLAEAVDKAREEALEEAAAEKQSAIEAAVEEALAAEREKSERERAEAIEAARAQWAIEEGCRLAETIDSRLGEAIDLVKASLAYVLKPVVLDARRRHSITELTEAADLLIGDGEAVRIKMSGPSDLLEAVAERLGERKGCIAFVRDETRIDARISCNETVIESRLENWRAALDEALA